MRPWQSVWYKGASGSSPDDCLTLPSPHPHILPALPTEWFSNQWPPHHGRLLSSKPPCLQSGLLHSLFTGAPPVGTSLGMEGNAPANTNILAYPFIL